MKILVIDDLKNVTNATKHARTFEEGIECLKNKFWDILYLDHDLGTEDHGKTGYDIMCFLEENPQYLPGTINIISLNGSGIQRMRLVIDKLYGRI